MIQSIDVGLFGVLNCTVIQLFLVHLIIVLRSHGIIT